jgi:NADH-quinone oxidoreductase subunit F
MPRKELLRENQMIVNMGVNIETGKSLGRDFTLQQLRDQGYEAVFLGVGAPLGAKLRIANEDAEGVYDSLAYLREYNLGGKAPAGKKVAVIGGGNAAIDAARTAIRLGAESVTVLYRRTRDEMPAYREEIEEAENEGVILKTLVAPQEIVVENGKAVGVRCDHMWLGDFDRSGRRRPQVREGGESFIEPADLVIAAIGQSLDQKAVIDGLSVKMAPNGYIAADPLFGSTSVEWLFAGGDSASGPSSVAEAIGAGERAAVGIDRYLSGEEHAFWREEFQVDTEFDPDADPLEAARARMELIPKECREHNFEEVELAFSEAVAVREARRCLRCDYRAEDSCVTSCR